MAVMCSTEKNENQHIMIRKYKSTDSEKVVATWNHAFRLAHPFLKAEYVEKVKVDMGNIYLPNSETWVYEEIETILGFVCLLVIEIGGLFILPSHHGKGIGTQLLDYVHQFHEELEVEVFEKNKIGIPFYHKYGFELLKSYFHEETQQVMLRMKHSRIEYNRSSLTSRLFQLQA